jgi:prepilin peptidase CpaA
MSFAIIWTLALLVALVAGVTDWRSRRIPNWLTAPALILGIAGNTAMFGWPGAKSSLEVAGLCLFVLLPFVLLRGMGAGDWKLMGALGAILGPVWVAVVLLGSIFVAGLMAVVQMVVLHRVRETLKNLWVLLSIAATFKFKIYKEISLDNPKAPKLPFGVAAALTTLLCFVFVGVRLRILR